MNMKKAILIVDDEPAILSGLSKAVTEFCGFEGEVIIAENGKKALEALSKNIFDICFLDIHLPDCSGVDLMEKIAGTSDNTKFLVMTAGMVTDRDMERIKSAGAMFVNKPIDLDIVIQYIKKSLYHEVPEISGSPRERRSSDRIPYPRSAHFSVSIFYNLELKSNQKGDIIDISEDGAGLLTSFPLCPGSIVKFTNEMEKTMGIIKWSAKHEAYYRSGIKFI